MEVVKDSKKQRPIDNTNDNSGKNKNHPTITIPIMSLDRKYK